MQTITQKQCFTCKKWKSIDEFCKRKDYPDGHTGTCIECRKQYIHNHYLKNIDKYKERTKDWKKDNRERKREYDRQWTARNIEKKRARDRDYYRRNVEKEAKRHHDARLQDLCSTKEKERIRRKKWHDAHSGKNTEYCNARRARKLKNGGRYTADEWKELKNRYNNVCLCCKRNDVRLEADHVIPLNQGGTNDISNIQPLCRSCNSSKGTKVIDYRKE